MKRFLLVLALGAALFGVALPAAAASTVEPSANYTKWGWVTVRDISPGLHTPAARDRGNSSGRLVTYISTGDGGFGIRFRGLADPGGVAHVTALNSAGRFCQVAAWFPHANGNDQWVNVDCFTQDGVHAGSKLTVSFLATNHDSGPLGYMYSGDDLTTDHNADPVYSYNSSGGTNTFTRISTGFSTVSLPGLNTRTELGLVTVGNMQVTAYYGTSIKGVCTLIGWYGESDGSIFAEIICVDELGNVADIPFTLTFTYREGLKGHGRAVVAYVFANQPSSPSYKGGAATRYSSAGKKPLITRSAVGTYSVSLPGMPAGGSVQVTHVDYSPWVLCNATSIRTSTPQKIGVHCRDMETHQPVDAKFSLSYEK